MGEGGCVAASRGCHPFTRHVLLGSSSLTLTLTRTLTLTLTLILTNMQLKLAQPEIAAAMYARVIATDGAAER